MGKREIFYKTNEEIELIRENCLLVSKALALVGEMIKPGMTGLQIDAAAEALIRDHGAEPGFKGYGGFPATLCVSPNEQVVHGIPTDKEFQEGDIVSVDCGVLHNGFYGDAAYTFALGEVDEKVIDLLEVTNTSLYKGIDQAIIGNRLGDISFAIQQYAQHENNYHIVRELVGHGLGRSLHEAPEVPNYGRRGRGVKLQEGLVIAIEPMVNLGTKTIQHWPDGWTVTTKDKQASAHYEHTIAILKDGPEILSDHKIVEEAISKNINVQSIGVRMQLN